MRFFPSSTTRKPVSQMWGQSDYCITLELFYICTYLLAEDTNARTFRNTVFQNLYEMNWNDL